MRMRTRLLLSCLLACGLMVACGEDKNDAQPQLDGSVPPLDAALDPTGSVADASDAVAPATPPPPAADALYMVATSVATADESTLLLMTGNSLSEGAFDPKKAQQFAGGGSVTTNGGFYYVAESEKQLISRYSLENGALVKGPSVSFLGMGIEWFGAYLSVATPTRAFMVSGDQLKIFEWNPTTMTTSATHDLSALKREGWGHEFRGEFYRESDGKLFLYWAYTNDRKDFINEFVLGVFDTKTNTLKVLTDPSCPATAGFGGYFDEQGDLYLFADSFGLFTKFGGFKDPKDACILRIKKDADTIDPSFKFKPQQALGGREPWGLYYAGNGIAYTTAVDPARINEYASVFELIFAPIHTGFLIDLTKNSATELTSIPKTGVGFESFTVGGRLLVPRSTGMVKIFDVETQEATIYEIKTDGSATPLFALPGSISEITRVR